VIAHVSIGVCDIDRSKPFYDAALESLGYKCLRQARTVARCGYGREHSALGRLRRAPGSGRRKVGFALPALWRQAALRPMRFTPLPLRDATAAAQAKIYRMPILEASVSGISRQRHGSFRAVSDTNWISSRTQRLAVSSRHPADRRSSRAGSLRLAETRSAAL
jgi:hypothetical protein